MEYPSPPEHAILPTPADWSLEALLRNIIEREAALEAQPAASRRAGFDWRRVTLEYELRAYKSMLERMLRFR